MAVGFFFVLIRCRNYVRNCLVLWTAFCYTYPMNKFIVILDGPMGSGKSTVGAMLAEKLKRTALINEDRIKWFISDFKRSKKDNAIVRAVMIEMCKEYLKQGISLVVAQGFLKGMRPLSDFAKMAKKNKAKLLIYHLDAPKNILLKRIENRIKTTKVKAPIAKSRIHKNIQRWKANRFSVGREFQTDKVSAKAITGEVLKDLGKNFLR